MSGKRAEGKEAADFQGGEYEAAVGQEKQDDRRSHRELVGEGLSEESDSGSEHEEVSVAALNVRAQETNSSATTCCYQVVAIPQCTSNYSLSSKTSALTFM